MYNYFLPQNATKGRRWFGEEKWECGKELTHEEGDVLTFDGFVHKSINFWFEKGFTCDAPWVDFIFGLKRVFLVMHHGWIFPPFRVILCTPIHLINDIKRTNNSLDRILNYNLSPYD